MSSKHAWMDVWCARTERVLHGRAAAGVDAGDSDAAVVILPQWLWRVPAIDVGRKGRDAGGHPVRLPIRIDWPSALLVMQRGTSETLPWRATGMGHDLSGQVTVTVADSATVQRHAETHVSPGRDGSIPTAVTAVPMSPVAVAETLSSCVDDGNLAWWELLDGLEPLARAKLSRAHTALSIDVSGSVDAPALLDPVSMDSLVDAMVLGSQEQDAPLARILERAMTPGTLVRVDPAKYISESLRRDAYASVRQRVGDPHVGSKVRRLARELGTSDPEVLARGFQRRYPNQDGVGSKRITAALSVAAAPRTVPLHEW